MYKIISTTDNKNISKIINFLPKVGDVITLENDYDFRIDFISIKNNLYILSNANYIIHLIKEK